MADSWFYGHGDDRSGPFSDRQLRDLADAGTILRTDTVWKDGVERGVSASRVKHLFAPVVASPAVADEVPAVPLVVIVAPVAMTALDGPEAAAPHVVPVLPLDELIPSDPPLVPLTAAVLIAPGIPEPVVPASSAYVPPPARQRTAFAVSGANIVNQDGNQVRYTKKCPVCNQVDRATSVMRISTGSMKATFFCPTCRKLRHIEMRGS